MENKTYIKYFCLVLIVFFSIVKIYSQSVSVNYTKTKQPQVPVSSTAQVEALTGADIKTQLIYYDGYGRPVQDVLCNASPTNKDIIKPYSYDLYGRENREFLPITYSNSNHEYINPIYTAVTNYYSQPPVGVPKTSLPYAEKKYDDSPLNQVMKQGFPGSDWDVNTGHPVNFQYTTNFTNEVIHWIVDASGNCLSAGYYNPKTLFVTKTSDENNKTIVEYKDITGNTVLIRNVDGLNLTYYVYDDYGLLRYVIPPQAMLEMNGVWTLTASMKAKWAYVYNYDAKHRLTYKKLPGVDPVRYIYDLLDRLILTTDGNLSKENKWIFTKYDCYSRPVISGIYQVTEGGGTLTQENIDAIMGITGAKYSESRTSDNYAVQMGYTNTIFPDITNNCIILSVNYYDDYDFNSDGMADESYTSVAGFNDNVISFRNNGLLTATKTRVMNNENKFLMAVNFYDDKYRLIQTKKENYPNGSDLYTNAYDFANKLIKTKQSQFIRVNMGPHSYTTDLLKTFEYDNAGRLVTVKLKLNAEPEITMSSLKYNELGTVIEKNLHKNSDNSYLQSVDYRYNARGWLTSINNSKLNKDNNISVEEPGAIDLIINNLTILLSGVSDGKGGEDLGISLEGDNTVIETKPDNSTTQTEVNTKDSTNVVSSQIDSAKYYQLFILKGVPLTLDFNQLVINETTGTDEAMEMAMNLVVNKLTSMGVNDPATIDTVASIVTDFILRYVNNIYTNDDNGDLFGMNLMYNESDASLPFNKQYNGNIGAIKWQTAHNIGERSYTFSYDNYNRLVMANYKEKSTDGWSKNNGIYDMNLEYDYNGNITDLNRFGVTGVSAGPPQGNNPTQYFTYGQIDALSYTYDGNKLIALTDGILDFPQTLGDFKNNSADGSGGPFSWDEYNYDYNGNMTLNFHKNIELIKYNYLNLPTEINFSDNRKITYLYDAAGNKLLKSTLVNNVSQSEKLYVGNFLYSGTINSMVLECINTDEGRIMPKEETWQYEYYLKDQLGDIMVTFADENNDGKAEVLQEQHYYPFGMSMGGLNYVSGTENKFKYNGKEMQDDFGLNIYDYGARMYDPVIGRWNAVDPLAEKRIWLSPYNYCQNNPMNRTDPTGALDDWYKSEKTEEIKWFPRQGKQGQTETIQGENWKNLGSDLLKFEGNKLTYFWQTKDDKGNLTLNKESWNAVAGKGLENADGTLTFDYSKTRQNTDNGPIPEGLWYVQKSQVQNWKDLSKFQKELSYWGKGSFASFPHGGLYGWGENRWWIKPLQVNTERDNIYGFTIHGGAVWGSHGCIDLTHFLPGFTSTFLHASNNNNNVVLWVDYSKISSITVNKDQGGW